LNSMFNVPGEKFEVVDIPISYVIYIENSGNKRYYNFDVGW
jgi:hypothetical protein